MSEPETIRQVEVPNSRMSIHKELETLGIEKGMTMIVHSSLSSLGWVCGGAVAVVQALMDTVGEEGTIVMPTQTSDNTDPAAWQAPAVPKEWWPIVRNEMPAYDPQITPTRGMGKIVETFRTYPTVKRSNHPTYSFAAWGKHANYIISEQPLEEGFGPNSPLAKIYELNGYILLLGVQHDSNTSLHLAEHAIPNREKSEKGTALFQEGKRSWAIYEEIVYDSEPFEALGKSYEEAHPAKSGYIGKASSKLINQRQMVDFAGVWLRTLNQHK